MRRFFFSTQRCVEEQSMFILTLILAAGRSPASICCLRLLISWANTFLSSSRSLRWRRASSVLTMTSTSFRNHVYIHRHKDIKQQHFLDLAEFYILDKVYNVHTPAPEAENTHQQIKTSHLNSCSSSIHPSVLRVFAFLCHLTSLL